MTKLHFDDLTQITCPLGLLNDDTHERFLDHSRAGGEIQKFQNGSWQDTVNCGLYSNSQAYRAKPKPKRLVTWLLPGKELVLLPHTTTSNGR